MAAVPQEKNVLLIVADDLGLFLGCYGLDTIRTPHIDRLAAEGTRFTSAFASTASCSGSRSTIYTGLHTHQNGQYGLHQGWCERFFFFFFHCLPRWLNKQSIFLTLYHDIEATSKRMNILRLLQRCSTGSVIKLALLEKFT